MRLRPQFQLRLRSAEQFASVSDAAARAGVSMNEWILGRVEDAAATQKSGSGRRKVDGGDVRGQEFRGGCGNRVVDVGDRDRPNGDGRGTGECDGLAGKEAGGDEAPVNPCRSCEEPLVASGGKLYCANQACGICGQEQKVRRAR